MRLSVETVDGYVKRYGLHDILSPDLTGALRLQRKGPGELIIRADDPVRDLFFLVEGRAKVYSTLDNGHRVLASFCKPFDVLGEVELFAFERYALNVEALTETVCLGLPAALAKRAAERNHRLLAYLCGRLGVKLAARVVAASINLRYPVENRLASYLRAALDGKGDVLGADDLGDLADFLGASYRQLGRVVRRFRDEGILDSRRGRLRVLDPAKLELLAQDPYV